MTTETMPETNSSEQVRSKRVELIIRQLEALPTLPVVATKVLQATTSKETSVKEVISLIESDQSLTAKILGLTRKAHLGLGGAITTVDKAVVMLGFEAIRNAILSIQVFETFGANQQKASDQPDEFNRQEFWKHCLAVACSAQLIVEQMPSKHKLDPDEVFVCGLLHDLGKVALDSCLPKSFARVVEIAVNNRTSIADVERRILGLDHAAIGKRLAEYWQLPEPIIHAIWLHHYKSNTLPENIKYKELVDVIYLADLIAREQRIGFSGNFIFTDRSETLASKMGIKGEGYQKVLLELRKRMGERASLIGLDEITSEQLYQQALQGANSELGRLNQSLTITNRKLKARSRYFEAINHLHQKLSPMMHALEMLEQMGPSVRMAFDVSSMVLYRKDDETRLLEAVYIDENETRSKMFELPKGSRKKSQQNDEHTFIVDPDDNMHEMILEFSQKLGTHPVKGIRMSCGDKHLGGVLISMDAVLVDRLNRERQEIEALMTACGLALGQSLALESKERMADELMVQTRQTQELEQKLLETRYMAAIGELAAGAAHELNNPLAIISGRAQLLQDQEPDSDKQKALDVITKQSHRASEIITELMDFAKPVKPQKKTIELNEFLESVVSSFSKDNSLKPDQIRIEVAENTDKLVCDEQQLAIVLKEILTNSLEASEPQNLKIKIQAVLESDGQYVQLRIADNGPGMEPEVSNRALDPFFSAKKAGRGRGLGLSRSYRYINSNNGNLWLESTLNIGTTVFIKLPTKIIGMDAKG
jgi:putative nucleotidyltransferase with HDIG domain